MPSFQRPGERPEDIRRALDRALRYLEVDLEQRVRLLEQRSLPAQGETGSILVRRSPMPGDVEFVSPSHAVSSGIQHDELAEDASAFAAASHGHTLADIDDAGTAAAEDATAFATSAQGSRADTAVQPGDLATVATSGSYNDLSDLPSLGTAPSTDASDYATAAQGGLADTAVQPGDLASVATSGSYADLSNQPSLGTAAPLDVAPSGDAGPSQVVTGDDSRLNDARTPVAHTHSLSEITSGSPILTEAAVGSMAYEPTSRYLRSDADDTMSGDLYFGSQVRQMLNLYSSSYGIGVQGHTLYFRTGNDFQFYKGGSHADDRGDPGGGTALMSIGGDGNVGIGITNPQSKLSVDGDIFVGSNSIYFSYNNNGTDDKVAVMSGSADELAFYSDATFRFFESDNDAEAFTIDANQRRVGVNNPSPAHTLHVGGTVRAVDLRTDDEIAAGRNGDANLRLTYDANPAVLFRNDGNFLYFLLTNDGDPWGSWNGLRPFSVRLSDGYVEMDNGVRMQGDVEVVDKLGVGTPSPVADVHVHGGVVRTSRDDDQYTEIVNNSASGGFISSHSREANKKGLYIQALHDASGSPAGINHITFDVGDSSSPAQIMQITESGVDVTGRVYATDWFRARGSSGLYFQYHGTGIRSVPSEGGTYGSVATYGGESGWEGYSIGGRVVLMHDMGSKWGIYNDVNNEWMVYGSLNGDVGLYYNNSRKLVTTSTGVRLEGNVDANSYRAASNNLGSVSGTHSINLDNGEAFTATVAGNTTFIFSGASGSSGFVLYLTGGGNHAITWPSAVRWPGGSAPDLTSGTDVLVFITHDGGSTWYGWRASKEAQ